MLIKMKKILVVEDDNDISNMLCDLLTQNGYLPTACFSGTEAQMCILHSKYDLILLDLMIPGKSGEIVLSEMKTTNNIPIIVVTAMTNKDTIVTLLKKGANDYITKPFDNDVLLARIEVQLRKNVTNENFNTTITFKDITLNLEQYDAFINHHALQLSKREFEILKILMENPQKVFTKNNLYESVWEEEFLGDDNTINVHISNLRSKIAKMKPDCEYIQTVWGIGFKMHK